MRTRIPGSRGRGKLWLAVAGSACVVGTVGSARDAVAASFDGLRLAVGPTGSNAAPVEISVVSNLCFYVGPGQTPSPWLDPGPFRATVSGELNLELRGDYQFKIESAGHFQWVVNETNLVASGDTSSSNGWSAPIRLRKGPNDIRATLSRSDSEEAFFRVHWKGRGLSPGPIPAAALKVNLEGDSGLENRNANAEAVRRGRDLFLQSRCGKCHAPDRGSAVPEMSMDAPSFEDLGRRRREDWIRKWIMDPHSLRSTATMPKLLKGPTSSDEARAMAAWLASVRTSGAEPVANGNVGVGRAMFENLQCGTCHTAPGGGVEPNKLALSGAREKFASLGWLAEYLKKPDAQYAWSPMPDFRLSATEAGHLATWILSEPGREISTASGTPAELLRQGRELIETRGCLACHIGPASNRHLAKPLAELPADWTSGCAADTPALDGAAPHYDFSTTQRADLRAFGRSDRRSLNRHVPADFARRWTSALRCDECHAKIPGIPGLSMAGEKLRPDWMVRLLSGGVEDKPRPWIQARMPAFPAYAAGISEGLAAISGYGTSMPPEEPIDEALAAQGRTMVSAGGFSCVSCHAIGPLGASAVFEAPGVNFIYVGERIRPGYFDRWVRNPQSIDPVTKMPLYFDEDGNSALTDFFGGDGPQTIRALWHYLRQGRRMVPPGP
jgi:mono/diheme cytochrome c family protein